MSEIAIVSESFLGGNEFECPEIRGFCRDAVGSGKTDGQSLAHEHAPDTDDSHRRRKIRAQQLQFPRSSPDQGTGAEAEAVCGVWVEEWVHREELCSHRGECPLVELVEDILPGDGRWDVGDDRRCRVRTGGGGSVVDGEVTLDGPLSPSPGLLGEIRIPEEIDLALDEG